MIRLHVGRAGVRVTGNRWVLLLLARGISGDGEPRGLDMMRLIYWEHADGRVVHLTFQYRRGLQFFAENRRHDRTRRFRSYGMGLIYATVLW